MQFKVIRTSVEQVRTTVEEPDAKQVELSTLTELLEWVQKQKALPMDSPYWSYNPDGVLLSNEGEGWVMEIVDSYRE